jgi:preprotein translocase subunit SecD
MRSLVRRHGSALALTLLLVSALTLGLGCSSEEPALAFHLVYPMGVVEESALPMRFDPTGETFYLHSEPFLTGDDVQLASTELQEDGARVLVVFHPAGSKTFATVTSEHVGDRVAMVVHGRLVSAPTVRAPITEGRAIIDGGFSEEEAQALVYELNRPPVPSSSVSGPMM